MRRVIRLYVTVSCVALGVALGGFAFLAAAYWIVPEWVRDVSLKASRELSRLAGEADLGDESGSQSASPRLPPPERDADTVVDIRPALLPSSPSQEIRDGAEAAAGYSDTGASQEHTHLDRISELEGKLEAWERLRGPLLSLLESSPDPADNSCADFAADSAADIRSVAKRIALRVHGLQEAERSAKGDLAAQMEPRLLARMLLEDKALSDLEAVACLRLLKASQVSEVIDRLSRLSPERAARLLRALSGAVGRATDSGGPEAPVDAARTSGTEASSTRGL